MNREARAFGAAMGILDGLCILCIVVASACVLAMLPLLAWKALEFIGRSVWNLLTQP